MRLYLPWKTFSGKAGFLFGRDFSFLRRKFQFCPKEIIFSFEQNNGYLLKEKTGHTADYNSLLAGQEYGHKTKIS